MKVCGTFCRRSVECSHCPPRDERNHEAEVERQDAIEQSLSNALTCHLHCESTLSPANKLPCSIYHKNIYSVSQKRAKFGKL